MPVKIDITKTHFEIPFFSDALSIFHKKKKNIKGMFLGAAIGDALGRPVESKSNQYIIENYGMIIDYQKGGFGNFKDSKLGKTTDDWQLTKSIMESIIDKKGHFDIDSIAEYHVKSYNESVSGWGGSTREAVEKLKNGSKWDVAGIPDKSSKKVRGQGNGIVMKMSSLVALGLSMGRPLTVETSQLATMTHPSDIAIESALCHLSVLTYLLSLKDASEFKSEKFLFAIKLASLKYQNSSYKAPIPSTNKFYERLKSLREITSHTTNKEIIELFNQGTCYVFDSLAMAYAFIIRDQGIETLYETITAGGDADTTGSIVASMLGLLHGIDIFPNHLIMGLDDKKNILEIINIFSATIFQENLLKN